MLRCRRLHDRPEERLQPLSPMPTIRAIHGALYPTRRALGELVERTLGGAVRRQVRGRSALGPSVLVAVAFLALGVCSGPLPATR